MISIEARVRRGEGRSKWATAIRAAAVVTTLLCALCQAQIANPGFENARSQNSLPYGACYPYSWSQTTTRLGFALGTTEDWSTEGVRSARIYGCYNQAVTAGDSMGFYQDMDLTKISRIVFDARLAAFPSGLFQDFEAVFLVDDQVLWSQTEDGLYEDVEVDVSRFSGRCRVELRCQALVSTTRLGAAYHTQWDNLRTIEGPTFIEASIDIKPDTLHLQRPGKWITCSIELPPEYPVDKIDDSTVAIVEGDTTIRARQFPRPRLKLKGFEKDDKGECDKSPVRPHQVVFPRAVVQALLAGKDGNTTLTVTGQLTDGTAFKGTDTIQVVGKPARSKRKCQWQPKFAETNRLQKVRQWLSTCKRRPGDS